MKKILIAILLTCCLCMFGCNWQSTKSEVNTNENSKFIIVETTEAYKIVYDEDTLVMYSVSSGPYNRGSFTLLVNPDGTPKLYSKEG